MDDERRRSPRVPCDLPVEWRRGLRTQHCRARDINLDGLFIATEVPVDLHYVMDVIVHLPSGPLEVLGVARFVGKTRHGHGIGIGVHAISNADRARWLVFYRAARHDLVAMMPPGIAAHFAPKL
jgi:hypothetical protein